MKTINKPRALYRKSILLCFFFLLWVPRLWAAELSNAEKQVETFCATAANVEQLEYACLYERFNLDKSKVIMVFDLETTGLSKKDRIMQIAYILISPQGVNETYTCLLNPEMPVSQGAYGVHGISNARVKSCKVFRDISALLLQEIKDAILMGYNSKRFDWPLLQEEFKRAGVQEKDIPIKTEDKAHLDVFPIAKKEIAQILGYKPNSYKLGELYRLTTGTPLAGAHNALVDIKATLALLYNLVVQGGLKGEHKIPQNAIMEVQSNAMLSLATQVEGAQDAKNKAEGLFIPEKGEYRINFGKKHQGKLISEILKEDPSYFIWAEVKNKLTPQIQATIELQKQNIPAEYGWADKDGFYTWSLDKGVAFNFGRYKNQFYTTMLKEADPEELKSYLRWMRTKHIPDPETVQASYLQGQKQNNAQNDAKEVKQDL